MTQDQIIETVLAFIEADGASENAFNGLALDLFAHQFENNRPFRQFSMRRERTPRTTKTWHEIPAVPISAFKDLRLSCSAPNETPHTFMTSGTTMAAARGKSHHSTLAVYDASMKTNFKHRFMSDRDTIRMGILFPDEDVMPNSSLAHYLALALRQFGAPNSQYMWHQDGIDFASVLAELEHAETTGEPYALLGASSSFVHLTDEMRRLGKSVVLPVGSRILDTGGFKGQSREVELDDFYSQLSSRLGVPRRQCINMYGMTELSTQFYDWGNETCPSVKSGPHWIRSRVINPLTGRDLPPGETGVLVHCDLAHFNITTTILTEDAGIKTEAGFILLGRADGSDAKGCSMMVEEFLKAADG